jgi:hypothetical protein
MSLRCLWHTLPAKADFQVMSDLHLEVSNQYSSFYIPKAAPYLILAGDIGRLVDYESYLDFLRSQCCQFTRVFLVLGNHEFYGLSREEGLRRAELLQQEPDLSGKLVVMNQTRITLDTPTGITILGCTLQSWIPPEAREIVEARVNDFRRIKNWTVDRHMMEYTSDVDWLQKQINLIRNEESTSGHRIVVITHHAPSVQESSRPSDIGSPLRSAFATDLLGINGVPLLSDVQWWIFGHTHYCTEFSKGNVKLVSNQRGYTIHKSSQETPVPSTILQSIVQRINIFSSRQGSSFQVQKVIRV